MSDAGDPFGASYAADYDALYADKDYDRECDLLEHVFARFARKPVRRVLDLGCGTGNHAVPLAGRGYAVVGVDRSESMLAVARRKAATLERAELSFQAGDVRTARVGGAFDAVVMMFAVLGYQTSDDDVLQALATARRHLHDGGLLVFDVWYGPAVAQQRPSRRVKRVTTASAELERVASPTLLADRHLCEVAYRTTHDDGDMSEEVHLMRYFFTPELREFLSRCGFDLIWIGAFPELECEPDEATWNVLAVASAR